MLLAPELRLEISFFRTQEEGVQTHLPRGVGGWGPGGTTLGDFGTQWFSVRSGENRGKTPPWGAHSPTSAEGGWANNPDGQQKKNWFR